MAGKPNYALSNPRGVGVAVAVAVGTGVGLGIGMAVGVSNAARNGSGGVGMGGVGSPQDTTSAQSNKGNRTTSRFFNRSLPVSPPLLPEAHEREQEQANGDGVTHHVGPGREQDDFRNKSRA